MNFNVLLAILEKKGIITNDEAYKIADYLQTATQSTFYKDAELAIDKLLKSK